MNKRPPDFSPFNFLRAGYAPKPCAWCSGTGHSGGELCRVCRGRGRAMVRQPAHE
ncbi:MAG TPA: hypothetical protein VNO70_17850 [Blastocatellia bacterium]|nr:hypothetical protein [Blastocatellia bacterium]